MQWCTAFLFTSLGPPSLVCIGMNMVRGPQRGDPAYEYSVYTLGVRMSPKAFYGTERHKVFMSEHNGIFKANAIFQIWIIDHVWVQVSTIFGGGFSRGLSTHGGG